MFSYATFNEQIFNLYKYSWDKSPQIVLVVTLVSVLEHKQFEQFVFLTLKKLSWLH